MHMMGVAARGKASINQFSSEVSSFTRCVESLSTVEEFFIQYADRIFGEFMHCALIFVATFSRAQPSYITWGTFQ